MNSFVNRFKSFVANNKWAIQIRRYLPILILISLLVTFFYFVPIQDILHVFQNTKPQYLIFGILIIIPFLFLDAMQLRILADKQSIDLSTIEIVLVNLKIRFYQMFVPGSVVGGGVRIYYFSQLTKDSIRALAILSYYRVYNIVLNVIFGGIFWLISITEKNANSYFIIITAIVIGFLVLSRLPFLSNLLAPHLKKGSDASKKTFWNWIRQKSYEMLIALSAFSELTWIDQSKMVLYSFLGQLAALLSYYWLALAIGINIGLADMGWIRAIILFSLYLPVNISSGLTVREIGFAALLMASGIQAEIAGAYSILVLGRTNLIALLGGVIEFTRVLLSKRDSFQKQE